MVIAGIVAGGTGSRMGTDIPKQFLELCGKAILVRTCECFLRVRQVDLLICAVHPDRLGYTEELFKGSFTGDELSRIRIIEGGADRTASLVNIVRAVEKEPDITSSDILLTHDAARPFISERIILDNIESAGRYGACTTALPASDTILFSADGSIITDTPERSKMFHAQTPQSFTFEAFHAAFDRLSDEQKTMLTDVCGIFNSAGMPVHIVAGDQPGT